MGSIFDTQKMGDRNNDVLWDTRSPVYCLITYAYCINVLDKFTHTNYFPQSLNVPGYFIPLYCCIGSSFFLRSLLPSVYQTSIHPTKPIARVPRSKAFLNAHRVPITQSFTYASIIECNILHCSCLLTSLSLPPECKLLDCRDHV